MTLERDAISLLNVPIDTSTISNGMHLVYDSTTRKWKLVQGLVGTQIAYVAPSSGGSPTVKLTFVNGVLTNNI